VVTSNETSAAWSRVPLERFGAVGRVLPALVPALVVAVIVVANAWSGLMPGVGFWDTAEFQTVLPILGTAHPTGYPTYVILGFLVNLLLFPIGEPAFRVTALSLLAVATAAGVTVALVRRLTGSVVVGVGAGLGLALTPVVWLNATRADPHPLHLAFVAILLFLLVAWEQARRAGSPTADRWLVGAAVVFALATGNHSLTLLLVPPVGLFVLAVHPGIVRRPRLIAACAFAVVATLALVYVELPLRAGPLRAPLVYANPSTWDGFWYIALAEQFRGSFRDPFGDLGGKFGDLVQLTVSQLGPLAWLLPPAFLATIRRAPRYALLTGSAMAITVIFNSSYSNADIQRYYLGPILWAWTWLAIFAAFVADLAATTWAALRRGRGARVPPMVAAGLAVIMAAGLLAPSLVDLHDRQFHANRSGDSTGARWLAAVLPNLAPDAVIVSWWSTSTTLWYGQVVEGLRPDVKVIDDRTVLDEGYGTANGAIERFLGQRPVYVIRSNGSDLALVLADYDLEPFAGQGSLTVYQVVGRRGATG
jgi:hypothetical protein